MIDLFDLKQKLAKVDKHNNILYLIEKIRVEMVDVSLKKEIEQMQQSNIFKLSLKYHDIIGINNNY